MKLLDKPGSLSQLLNHIADQGANIVAVAHDRLSTALSPNETNVSITCEVGGAEHGKAVVSSLESFGYTVTIN